MRASWVQLCLAVFVLVVLVSLRAADRLEIYAPAHDPWVRLHSSATNEGVYRLEATGDFLDWLEIATTHDGLIRYPDADATNWFHRAYRFTLWPKTDDSDWKNQIRFPGDAFLSLPTGFAADEILWMKFAVVLADPARVVYQDSGKYLFHYHFAKERLEGFSGLSPAEFDAVSLRTNNQQIVLGTVLYPPAPNEAEFGIQFVGLDPYPPEQVAALFKLVQATVIAQPGVGALYVPTFEQSRVAETNRAFFENLGIQIASTSRWLAGNQCYAPGWALGRLQFVVGEEIHDAYADGRLGPGDILLTDAVPAEIPFVAGVIALQPSTPNSHVALLARNFGIPFVHLADPDERARVQELAGRKVILRVTDLFLGCEIRVIDVEGQLTPELEAELLALKQPPQLDITPKATFGAYSVATDGLVPEDIRYFGGKAANFGFLRRSIPAHSPVAIAFSFDLWDEYLDQTLPGAGTLRHEIDERLAGLTYPPDIAELRQNLDEIRQLIRSAADFTPAQRGAITNAVLAVFDPTRKIRFRSSTNVEDSEQFTGAGLYDSYSGCLLDDLDGDNHGPSLCDPEEEDERGVFRAMRRVYASFYNENAFLERLRHGVDESTVGMGVLVHYSAPDEQELANGVATFTVHSASIPQRFDADMVTQKGAVPVTNPDNSAVAEQVQASRFSFGTFLSLRQRSSLVPLGAYVLEWEQEYREFVDLFAAVSTAFARHYPEKSRYVLDFEYKKMIPGDLVVKQVRQLPSSLPGADVVPFLIHETNRYVVFQGEFADEFANHYLKSFWSFSARNMRLSESNRLAGPIYETVDWEYLENDQRLNYSGPLQELPNFSHRVDGETLYDSWTLGSGPARRDYTLIAEPPFLSSGADAPIHVLSDFNLTLEVRYATPVPALDYEGQPIVVTQQVVRLTPMAKAGPTSLRQERTIESGPVTIHTTYFWPDPPVGIVAGYTAPLIEWVETTITGLTTEPIVLRGELSQTYNPGHHNFTEDFIFEPRLEPGMAPGILAELQTKNVKLIQATTSQFGAQIQLLGFDSKFHLPE